MNVVRVLRTTAALSLIALLNSACSTVSEAVSDATPYGVQLRERVEQWDRWCKGEKLGPYNTDPRRAHITTCDFLYLKDQRWDPNADEFSRYAHSIKLPPPHDQPQAQYRPGMTSKQYFEELCAKEAGQWIFRTVTGVQGVLQGRPHMPTSPRHHLLIPNTEEPFSAGGNTNNLWIEMGDKKSQFSRYSYFEYPTRSAEGAPAFTRYYRPGDELKNSEAARQPEWRQYLSLYSVPFIVDSVPRSDYAFVWRGTFREEFLEHGIEGGEFLVIHYKSREVLAFVRTFFAFRPKAVSVGGLHQEVTITPCAGFLRHGTSPDFLQQVLIPSR